jgi:hypothetical protein
MAPQVLCESQVGGSIIGLMSDFTREDAFRNNWSPMEEQLGLEQVMIFGLPGLISSGLFAYAHIVLSNELVNRVSTEDNYPTEAHSC